MISIFKRRGALFAFLFIGSLSALFSTRLSARWTAQGDPRQSTPQQSTPQQSASSSQRPIDQTQYETHSETLYETRADHDPNGIGKFYMGREIAHTMGPAGIPWLDRPEREYDERPSLVMEALGLRGGEVVADLGAGSGYFTFRMAPIVGKMGKVLAVEIQNEMLQTIRQRAQARKLTNVEVVKGTETDPHLPANGVDVVLLVDVYHEMAYPYEVMTHVREALKPGGRVVLVEYRKEDPDVPIKEVHKMTVEQVQKEMNAVGLVYVQTVETLPQQHILIFKKAD